MASDLDRIREVRTFPSLIKYLRDDLKWEIETEDIDEIAFEFEPEELGLDPRHAVKVRSVKQIRPLTTNQAWGVFYIDFEAKRLPVVVLRHILRHLIPKQRASANSAKQAVWKMNDLLFISSHGETATRGITFAHFRDRGDGKQHLRTISVAEDESEFFFEFGQHINLEKLRWPGDPSNIQAWEEQWGSAFRVGHREVIRTSQELAEKLALLAKRTRRLIAELFECEVESGPLHRMFDSFRASLVHDMTSAQFADMYAQTLAYGLFSAKASGESVFGMAGLEEIVPATNPFLKRLFKEFVNLGERRKQKIDFDEIGVGEIVDLLDHADLRAILDDFGRQSGGGAEDPVVHFYEDFLQIYDKKQKKGRGVYYTPKPVVSYIVRSVDEILKKDFGLVDGLADNVTWSEMATRLPDLKLPAHAKPDDPFVRIFDPATGTGTFLDTVIEVIFGTLTAKWKAAKMTEEARQTAWNKYVPAHLLPRLFGFELMMAPYAVCHMKLAYTLKKTGYDFKSDERLRVYLTNALEPAAESDSQLKLLPEFLASEARDANVVKSRVPVTVVIGNPPYSGISSNMNPWIDGLLKGMLPDGTKVRSYYEIDGKPLGEKKVWLQDDYVKFLRYAQWRVEETGRGVLGMITNHGYLDNPTFRGMRQQLMGTFDEVHVLDLHGNAKKKERAPDGGADENVFDIEQGVAIGLMARISAREASRVSHADLWGERESKYGRCLGRTGASINYADLAPNSPFYFFVPKDESMRGEYEVACPIQAILKVNTTGIVTARDHFVIDFDEADLMRRIADLRDTAMTDAAIRKKYFEGMGSAKYPDGDSRGWKLPSARKAIREDRDWKKRIAPCLYRPFDIRHLYNVPWMVDWSRPEVMRHMLEGNNLGFYVCRQIISGTWQHILPTTALTDDCFVSNKSRERGYLFPIYLYPSDSPSTLFDLEEKTEAPGGRRPNLDPRFVSFVAEKIGLAWVTDGAGDLAKTFGPEDLFHAIYAQFHSPTYRSRYAESLKSDFPRVFTPTSAELFASLARLGADLVALHLVESEYKHASWTKVGRNPFKHPVARFRGAEKPEVAKGYPQFEKGKVLINETEGFEGVPEPVWNFQVGGYQVCEKWLKDRRIDKLSRPLSDDDIAHYGKIVIALNETIRLMSEVDAAISAHGGWPDAFLKEKIDLQASEPKKSVPVQTPREEPPPTPKQKPTPKNPAATATDAPGSIHDIDRNEMMAVIRETLSTGGARDRDIAIRDIARACGFQRAGKNIRETLEGDLIAAGRRGIIVTESGVMRLLCRSIEDYDRDFLKDQLLGVMGATWWERTDALKALASHLGFRRCGEIIQEIYASIVNGLIREERLESSGTQIRRAK